MKKLGAALLAAAMLMTGCGSTAASDNVGDASQATDGGETAKSDSTNGEKITIEYWHINSEGQGQQTVEEFVAKFNETHDNIEVIPKYNADSYKGLIQNLQAEAAVGNNPGVVQIGWSFLDYSSNNFSYLAPQDAIDKYDPEDSTFLTDNFLPNILDLAVNSNGEQVGIPYSVSNPVLYYNVDLFREAGLPEEGPETWEQVIEYSQTIKDKTGKYGLYVQEPSVLSC